MTKPIGECNFLDGRWWDADLSQRRCVNHRQNIPASFYRITIRRKSGFFVWLRLQII